MDEKSFFNNISISKTLMILYLIIFTNIISHKISDKIYQRVESNLIIKHIIGLITVGVILSLLYTLNYKELIGDGKVKFDKADVISRSIVFAKRKFTSDTANFSHFKELILVFHNINTKNTFKY